MVVDQQVAIEVIEFELVVRMQCGWPGLGHPELFDQLQVGILFLGLKEFRVGWTHGVDFDGRRGTEVQRDSRSRFFLDDENVLECRGLEACICLLVEMREIWLRSFIHV